MVKSINRDARWFMVKLWKLNDRAGNLPDYDGKYFFFPGYLISAEETLPTLRRIYAKYLRHHRILNFQNRIKKLSRERRLGLGIWPNYITKEGHRLFLNEKRRLMSLEARLNNVVKNSQKYNYNDFSWQTIVKELTS